ncbi:MAG: hypothetical protein K1X75_09050 [Leptospirales bacterium]|nr:hypothetical protein [Leptospirales bacterium]
MRHNLVDGRRGAGNPRAMELAALILVNLFLAALMYLFFSMRFSRALSEARRSALPEELKENVRLAVQFIDNSIEFIQDKHQSFYSLVRHAEGISRSLRESMEQLEAQSKKGRRGAARSRKAVEDLFAATQSDGRKPTHAAEASGKEPQSSAEPDAALRAKQPSRKLTQSSSTPPEDALRSDTAIERALGRLGNDSLELSAAPGSAEAAYREGMLSRAPRDDAPASAPNGGELVAGVLGRIGGAVMKLMGAEGLSSSAAPAASVESIRRSQRFEIPEAPAETIAPHSVARLPPSSPRVDRFERSSDDDLAPVFSAASREIAAPGRSSNASASDGNQSSLEAELELALRQADLRSLLARRPEERSAILRLLLSYGYDAEQVARESGAARAEVELLASLPGVRQRPRRQRLEH